MKSREEIQAQLIGLKFKQKSEKETLDSIAKVELEAQIEAMKWVLY